MRHALLLAYYYPPMPTVAAFRMKNIREALEARGYVVHVISSDLLHHFGPVEDPQLHTVSILDYRSLKLKFQKGKLHYSGKSSMHAAKFQVGKWLRALPMAYLIGEGGGVYYQAALMQARKLCEQYPINLVISSFAPLTDHLIAGKLKQKYPAMKWVADFRDLPIDRFKNNIVWPDWHQSRFRKIFEQADQLWAVSEGQKDLLHQLLGKEVKKVPNGLDPSYKIPQKVSGEPQFTLTYTGSLYPYYPSELWKRTLRAFAEKIGSAAEQMLLRYAGKDGLIFRQWAEEAEWPGQFQDLGERSRRDCWSLQQTSTVNLLFSWNQEGSRGILTGKLYEYLGARKPILALSNGDCDGELRKLIVSKHGSQSLCTDDLKNAGIFLETAYNRYSSGDELLVGDFDKLQKLFFQLPESAQT